MAFMEGHKPGLTSFGDIGVGSFREYRRVLIEEAGFTAASAHTMLASLKGILNTLDEEVKLDESVVAYLSIAGPGTGNRPGVSGYSDEIFNRIKISARSEVVAIRSRIRAGRALVERFRLHPEGLTERQQDHARLLECLLRTGTLPSQGIRYTDRTALASEVFLTENDLAPLLILFVAISGMNVEAIKELPAAHTVHDSSAVQVQVVKRRRGDGRWYEPVVWAVGTKSRQLHSPGGFYQLVDELSAPARAIARSDKLLAVWTNTYGRNTVSCRYPWEKRLSHVSLFLNRWAERNKIVDGSTKRELTFNRIRTTYLRRETKTAGGHLPSATRGNTQDVLFNNYLRGDATVIDWAEGVMGETFEELEEDFRARRSHPNGQGHRISTVGDLGRAASEATPTAFLSCRDILHGPYADGEVCDQSALICFSCPNAIVGEGNLPAIVNLLDELHKRSEEVSGPRWWSDYGQAWLAITDDILPRFTAAQIDSAKSDPSLKVPLKLLEDRI
ncbi:MULTISPECIES: hypothetical protein [unclassified Cryobacterium]|uniref:hypothetical protein n=1 Tax=unclassified Cryobacterium TaxID=2649013 RepID=UPI002AB32B40|nr:MULTISPECIES: hypothetical protein [unclassified Cryobacterium]MDY7528156.1 hypothetical protein [Cryobacterium sp. 10C2]MDY7556095.1 hypothetical protein [Cryobacterium sp. 10C3]